MPSKEPRKHGSVSAPSEELPRARKHAVGGRTLLAVVKVVIGLVLLVSLGTVVAVGARHFARTSDRFALEHLLVEGATRFSHAELCKLMGVEPGNNLFALDLRQAETKLAQHPWVAEVRLERKLPSTLRLTIREYRAEAAAAIGDQLYLITAKGHPIVRFDLGERGEFPVITGVTLDDLAVDRPRALERLAMGVEILDKYTRSTLASTYAAQELHLSSDGSIELVAGERGVTLMFGRGPVEQKLLMAARVVARVRARGEVPRVVFLDNEAHPERVVVRLR